MRGQKQGFEESLEKNVILAHKCVGCAACVVACPFGCLEYVEDQPLLVKKCERCGICSSVCPEYKWSWSQAEQFVFKRPRRADEEFGIHRRLALARATDKTTLRRGQDGGAVTALLICALRDGMIEGAAVSGTSKDRPMHPVPRLAMTPDQMVEAAGTRYTYSPNLLAFQEGVKLRKKTLAFVGTPCQIHAIRRLQMLPLEKYSHPLQFTIGLMCTESFTYEGLTEQLLKRTMGLDLYDVAKMNIKARVLVDLKSGGQKNSPLADASKYARSGCHRCNDFSAELADISAGGLGLKGWTFIILRTKQGERVFDSAVKAGALSARDVAEEPSARMLLAKLSGKKRQNSPRS